MSQRSSFLAGIASIGDGLASIGEGLASLLAPAPRPPARYIPPRDDDWQRDQAALTADGRRALGRDQRSPQAYCTDLQARMDRMAADLGGQRPWRQW